MSDKIVGYVCVGGMAIVLASNFWMGKQVTDLKAEVQTIKTETHSIKTEIKEIKKDVAEVQKIVLYNTLDKIAATDKDMFCLAKNIFHEAGVESFEGKVAVAQITLNRVDSKRWGKTICDVVYAKAQFSWTLDKKKKFSKPKGKLWLDSVLAAKKVINEGHRIKGLESSGFYHTDYIQQPNWAASKTAVIKIGQHIFYQGVDA